MSGFQFDQNTPHAFIYSAPTDNRDYSIDWTNLLNAVGGDTIVNATWNVPSGVTLGNNSVSGNITTAWLTTPGPNPIGTYYVSCTVITTGGRNWTRGFNLIIAENQ